MLLGYAMGGLAMMMVLLCMVWMVVLVLELWHRYCKPRLNGMWPLVPWPVHWVGIEGLRGSRRGGRRIGRKFDLPPRVSSGSKEMSLVGVLNELLRLCLEVELPGPRLLEPVGTICHLTWQTRFCIVVVRIQLQK